MPTGGDLQAPLALDGINLGALLSAQWVHLNNLLGGTAATLDSESESDGGESESDEEQAESESEGSESESEGGDGDEAEDDTGN
mmetsp:Transcript_53898/g.120871  ORF Transcript_53898/g.120871 Transcript_53898/m.120871 type:complete len:84 (-) Transcript_53898:293-544(-)